MDVSKGRAFPPDGFGFFWKQNRSSSPRRLERGRCCSIIRGWRRWRAWREISRGMRRELGGIEETGVEKVSADLAGKRGDHGFLNVEFLQNSVSPAPTQRRQPSHHPWPGSG